MATNKKRGFFRRAAGSFVDVRGWSSYDYYKDQASALGAMAKDVFVHKKPEGPTESFNDATSRFELTPQELWVKQRSFLRLALFFAVISGLLFLYTLFFIIKGLYMGGLLSTAVMGVTLALSFRYHFWYFQIKNQKLGCTFREWLNSEIVDGEDKS